MSKVSKPIKINYVLKIIESVLNFKHYEERDEVLRVAQSMARTAIANEKYSQDVKDAYLKAFEEIQSLSFKDMQEIMAITSATGAEDETGEDEE